MKTTTTLKTLTLGLALLGTSLMADGATIYKKCAGCHGANGEKAALGKSKIIKDLSETELMTAMKGYKDGSYGGPMKGLMKGQVAKLSDADVDAVVKHMAGL
jgi:cytochrome c